MNKLPQYIGQVVAYGLFMLFIAYFSSAPDWAHTQPDEATVKVSIRHAGQILGECRDLSVEELSKLPPNMKVPQVCPRERSPVSLKILLNGKLLYEETANPSGLQNDGVSTFYSRFTIPAGEHNISATLKDNVNDDQDRYEFEQRMRISPRQVVVVDFKDGFIFK